MNLRQVSFFGQGPFQEEKWIRNGKNVIVVLNNEETCIFKCKF